MMTDYPRCRTCKWWERQVVKEKPAGSDEWQTRELPIGKCTGTSSYNLNGRGTPVWEQGIIETHVTTGEDFGCRHHEPKEPGRTHKWQLFKHCPPSETPDPSLAIWRCEACGNTAPAYGPDTNRIAHLPCPGPPDKP